MHQNSVTRLSLGLAENVLLQPREGNKLMQQYLPLIQNQIERNKKHDSRDHLAYDFASAILFFGERNPSFNFFLSAA